MFTFDLKTQFEWLQLALPNEPNGSKSLLWATELCSFSQGTP
jgi:hypothetical protein